jgi:uncharacterized membrane protein YhhN
MTMTNLIIVGMAAVFVLAALGFEKKGSVGGNVVTKAAASLLFIAAAVVQPHPLPSYYRWILFGLVFCLGGDVFLALPGKKMFLAGLVSFLLGHVLYVVALFQLVSLGPWFWAGLPVVAVVSGFTYYWLCPYLGKMTIPVLVYIFAISVMLCAAWAVIGMDGLPVCGRLVIFTGALLFFVSDLFVARQRFLVNTHLNRLIGLPMYYAGQFLLAFSVGMVG